MQPLHISNQAGCIDESRWRCRPNKHEAKYNGCVCRDMKSVQYLSWESKCVLYWSCDSPKCANIGYVTRKSVLYSEYKVGGTFSSPMQNTIMFAYMKIISVKKMKTKMRFQREGYLLKHVASFILGWMVLCGFKSCALKHIKKFISYSTTEFNYDQDVADVQSYCVIDVQFCNRCEHSMLQSDVQCCNH